MSTKIPCQWVGRCLLTGLVTAALASRCVLAQDSQGPVNSIYNFMFGAPAATAGTSSAAADRPASSLASDLSRPDPYSLSRNPVVLVSDQVASPPNQPAAPPEQQTPPPDQQKLGQAPEDYSHQFLRQESVLLKPGEWQLDVGINYTLFDHNYTNVAITQSGGQTITTAVDSRLTSRLLLVPLDSATASSTACRPSWTCLSAGPTCGEFVFRFRRASATGWASATSPRESRGWFTRAAVTADDPDVIATFALHRADGRRQSAARHPWCRPTPCWAKGSGSGSWNVLFIHTLDPLIVFYGFGSRHGVRRGMPTDSTSGPATNTSTAAASALPSTSGYLERGRDRLLHHRARTGRAADRRAWPWSRSRCGSGGHDCTAPLQAVFATPSWKSA